MNQTRVRETTVDGVGDACHRSASRAGTPPLKRRRHADVNGRTRRVVLAGVSAAVLASAGFAQTETIRVDLVLRTGGTLSGLVVDHTAHGLVIMHETTPYVFAWDQIKTPSAYSAKRDLRVLARGGVERLTAEDHFQLGLFALSRHRTELAATEFARAGKLDESCRQRAREAFAKYREQRAQRRASRVYEQPLVQQRLTTGPEPQALACAKSARAKALGSPSPSESVGPAFQPVHDELTRLSGRLAAGVDPQTRDHVLAVYKSFGETVRQVIGGDVALIETDHFLIWTDFSKRRREALPRWCEAMYTALCSQFRLDPAESIFLAKCPVFCWRSKRRFQEFARRFDNHDGSNSIGYTRSIEASGHVHVVLLRLGQSEADFDRFASTLVHEGTHAFVHRLYSTRLIPHWVNEGYADLMAERILGDRCPNAENATLLGLAYARYDWPINGLLDGVGPIEVHQYPLAHSVVRYLEGRDPRRFAAFVRGLKTGQALRAALAGAYEGMTPADLEARWRSAIRADDR